MNSPNVNNDVALRCVALPTAGRQTANIPRVDLASMQLARSRLDRAKFSPQKEDQMNDRGHHPAKVGEEPVCIRVWDERVLRRIRRRHDAQRHRNSDYG